MEGYDVVTSDDHKVGRVVGSQGNLLIVEHGMLRKSRHAVPKDIARPDESEQVVRLTISRDVFEDAPATKDGDEIDEREVAEYFGLAGGVAAPETAGYGDVTPDDPGRSAEQEGQLHGQEAPEEQRARMRETPQTPETDLGPTKGSAGIHQDRWEVKE